LLLGPEHSLLRGLRESRSETELTRALASVFDADKRLAASFARLVLERAPNAERLDLSGFPDEMLVRAEEARITATEEREGDSRLDLSFADTQKQWHVIVELKIHASYGTNQVGRYLDAFYRQAERTFLVAVTRNVPSSGESSDPRWAGSVRWADLLGDLQGLDLSNALLGQQWSLFLDVLEAEGAMGFTNPNKELMLAWASFPSARQHGIDFVDALRRPLLDELQLSLAQPPGTQPSDQAAAFFRRGKSSERVVFPQFGKITTRFHVPANGPVRIVAGLWGWDQLNFIVETPYPTAKTDAARDAIAYLQSRDFGNWRNQLLTRYLHLDEAMLARATLQEEVIKFARGAFDEIMASHVLSLDAVEAEEPASDGDA
jgi:hypothetical protein